jgi:predicted dehydrogenase
MAELRNAEQTLQSSRRSFLKGSTAAMVGGSLAALGTARMVHAAENNTLKVGLVGCGGRGSGAALQALNADPQVILTAMGDAFPEPLQQSLAALSKDKGVGERVKVTPETSFVGLDAYQKVIDSGVDVVLLASPPGFRPYHLAAAVKAGKHIFCEKPMATDAPGVRSVLESSRLAKEKNLCVASGFCWRSDSPRREFYKLVLDGFIGDIQAIHATYLTGPVKPMPPASERPKNMGDLAWQMRHWYNFAWLSGDGLVEQACHSVDKILWAMRDKPPAKAVACGGRMIPNNEGNIYDHISVFYEWDNGARATMAQRQVAGCCSENADYLLGTKGKGAIKGDLSLDGATSWRYKGPKPSMYQVEHDELFAAIRAGKPFNHGEWMANSTLAAIMGRMAAYTGQQVTWEMAMNSKEKLVPDAPAWDMSLPIVPLAIPGVTKFA